MVALRYVLRCLHALRLHMRGATAQQPRRFQRMRCQDGAVSAYAATRLQHDLQGRVDGNGVKCIGIQYQARGLRQHFRQVCGNSRTPAAAAHYR